MSDPAEKMRFARRLVARALGIHVDDLPPDADVEIALSNNGETAHVRGSVVATANVKRFTFSSRFVTAAPNESEVKP